MLKKKTQKNPKNPALLLAVQLLLSSTLYFSFVTDGHGVESRVALSLCQDHSSECARVCVRVRVPLPTRPPGRPLLTVLKFQTRLKESLFLRLILLPSGTRGSSAYMAEAARRTRRANLGTCTQGRGYPAC